MATLNIAITKQCNGRCPFCIDRHANNKQDDLKLLDILSAAKGYDEVLILGGEPLLHPKIIPVIKWLKKSVKKVILTTNGSMIRERLAGLALLDDLNISIHSPDLEKHRALTGIFLEESELRACIRYLHEFGVKVRINCNLIKGYVDSAEEREKMEEFAKRLGADGIRFSELTTTEGLFGPTEQYIIDNAVEATEVDGHTELSEPKKYGCNQQKSGFVSYKVFCDKTKGCPRPGGGGRGCVNKGCGYTGCQECKFYTYGKILFNNGKIGQKWSDYSGG